mgnify:FL=1
MVRELNQIVSPLTRGSNAGATMWCKRSLASTLAALFLVVLWLHDGHILVLPSEPALDAQGDPRGHHHKILGKEAVGDENVMGAVLAYEKQGVLVNYLSKEVNVEFSRPH